MNCMKVVHELKKTREEQGSLPKTITVDNASELCGRAPETWVIEHSVELCFIRPARFSWSFAGQRPLTGGDAANATPFP